MDKQLLLTGEAHSVNEWFTDINSFRVSLSAEEVARIQVLRDAVIASKAYCICDWCCVEWFANSFEEIEEGGALETQRSECDQMHVTEKSVYFTAYPRHANASEKVESELFDIDTLMAQARSVFAIEDTSPTDTNL
jgi:hypothetical protein